MNWTLLYGCFTLFSGLVCAGVALYLAPHWQQKNARYLMLLMAATSIWVVGYAMEFFSPTLEQKLWWTRLEYLGTTWLGIFVLKLTLSITEKNHRLSRRACFFLGLFPPTVMALVLTNDHHQLMWQGVELYTQGPIHNLNFHRGPAFWGYVVLTYMFMLMGLLHILQEYGRSRGARRRQLGQIFLAILLPWGGNIVYLFHVNAIKYLDISPFTFMASGLILAWGLFRSRFLNVIPLAHQALMDSMADPVVVLDMEDRIMAVNQAFHNHFTQCGPIRPGQCALAKAAPELHKHVQALGSNPPAATTITAASRHWDMRISPLIPPTRLPMGRLIALRDITEQSQYREYIAGIIDSMPSIIMGVTQDGHITHWNSQAEDVTQLPAHQARNRHMDQVMPQLGRELPTLYQALAAGENQTWEKIDLTLGAKTRTTRVTLYPIPFRDRSMGAVIRIDDITEQVRMEEMIIHSERMISVGGLAAGMAHEINNPLSGMLQNLQVLENRLSKNLKPNRIAARAHDLDLTALGAYMTDREIFKIIDMAMASGKRISDIINNMLSFTRKNDDRFRPHALDQLMEDTLALIRNDFTLGREINLDQLKISWEKPWGNAPGVICNGNAVQQVFFNILKNGIQAMAGSPAPGFTLTLFHDGHRAGIKIQDHGPGIPEPVRKRIFEPFFTTKETGVGTGLGLSVSYFIITEAHGGSLTATSPPGQGACFTITLPMEPIRAKTGKPQ
ncbi:MAG: ATP-binding protein [Desulfobacterales bacterium]|nr:ATP-binding protein [Desulfobacterales bacterium]